MTINQVGIRGRETGCSRNCCSVTSHVHHDDAAVGMLRGRRVLVTGAAGSIGSELARQTHALGADVYFLDCRRVAPPRAQAADHRRWSARRPLRRARRHPRPSVASVRCSPRSGPRSSSTPRLTSTCRCSSATRPKASRRTCSGPRTSCSPQSPPSVGRFILVSTDKAADPTSVLGATKRLAENLVTLHSPMRVDALRLGALRQRAREPGIVAATRSVTRSPTVSPSRSPTPTSSATS